MLLDTHALFWFIDDNAKLSSTAASVIGDPANEILFSPATYWEMAIKISLGKWQLNQSYADFVDLAVSPPRSFRPTVDRPSDQRRD